jgi:uncharacterized delta-60 repeat protein
VAGGQFGYYAVTFLDSDGNLTGSLDDDPFHAVHALVPLPDGAFLAGGWNPVGYFDGWPTGHDAEVVSFSSAGAAMNSHRFEGNPTDVFALARRPDGKVVCGGSFLMDVRFEDVPVAYRYGIMLFGDSLAPVHSFDPVLGTPGTVNALAPEADGSMVVGGDFLLVNGVLRKNLARLLPDGSLDDTFTPPDDLPAILRMVRQDDGRLVVGTDDYPITETDIGGPKVRRLLADGGYDDSFQPCRVRALALTLDAQQRVLVGGTADATFPGLVRLLSDGAPDPDFDVGKGLSNSVQPGGDLDAIHAIVVQDDGKILAGGSFDAFNEIQRSKIVRLLDTGAVDPSFVPPEFQDSAPRMRPEVHAFQLVSDGKILVGGKFSSGGGTANPLLVRLNADGSLDPSFSSTFPDTEGPVRAFLPMPGGAMLVGGLFQYFAPEGMFNGLVEIQTDGTHDPSFCGKIGYDGWDVRALARDAGGRFLAGGGFAVVNDEPHVGLVAYAASPPEEKVPLEITTSTADGGGLELRWPASASGYHAESCDTLDGHWTPVAETPVREGDDYVLRLPMNAPRRFYRLVGP